MAAKVIELVEGYLQLVQERAGALPERFRIHIPRPFCSTAIITVADQVIAMRCINAFRMVAPVHEGRE
eukprot:12589244-Alexandrium_andersonii.AAC.1